MSTSVLKNHAKVANQAVSSSFGIISGNTIYRRRPAEAGGAVNFGQEVRFRVERIEKDLIRNAHLQIDLSALTVATGTAEWSNKLALSMIEAVWMRSGGSELVRIQGDTLLQLYPTFFTKDEWEQTEKDNIGDFDTQADRQTASASAQTLYVQLGHLLPYLSRGFPSYLVNNNDGLEVVLKFRPFSDCVVVGDSGSITKVELWQKMTHAGDDLTNHILKQFKQSTGLAKYGIRSGYMLFAHDYTTFRQSFASGISDMQLQMNGLSGEQVVAISFQLHTSANLNSGVYDEPLAVDEYALKDGNKYLGQVEDNIDNNLYKSVILPSSNIRGRDHMANVNTYIIPFSDNYAAEFDKNVKKWNYGVSDMQHINNATLHLHFDSAPAEATTLIVNAVYHRTRYADGNVIKKLGK